MADDRAPLFTVDLGTGPADAAAPASHPERRPPRWLARGLAMAVVAVFVGVLAWRALGSLTGLLLNLVLAFFLALVLEPAVVWLVRHGWRRAAATGAAMGAGIAACLVVVALFGKLFVEQVVQLLAALPQAYEDVRTWASDALDVTLPASQDVVQNALARYGNDVASGAWLVGTTLIGWVFSLATVLLVTYYLSSAGPRFRRAVCSWLPPERQSEVLRLWDITQIKVSDFVTSRVVLAALSSVFTWIFLQIIGTPYAIPLALFTGVVSQFVPTIGTYIGGALPVVVALTTQDVAHAVAVLVFIVLYQQVENYVFSPKISGRALEMNPAVSFVAVLAFGAVFGAIGAFLALPVAATVQAVASTYLQRHELVEAESLRDPERAGRGDDGSWGRRASRRRRANRSASLEAARAVDERREQGIE